MEAQSIVSSSLNSLWGINTGQTTEADKLRKEQEAQKIADEKVAKEKAAQKAKNPYGMPQINQLAEAAKAAFEGLGLGPGDRVTFSRITEYRDKLQAEFADKTKAGLKELGVSEDTEYQIVTNYNGEGVKIVTDSEDKTKIEQYFKENPKEVEKFKEIQYLDNLDKARSQGNISPNMMSSRLQLQAMSAMFHSNPSSSIMSNGQGGSFFGMGLSMII